MMRSWRGAIGATALAIVLSGCSGGTQAAPATSTVTAVHTVTTTTVSTMPAVTEIETQTETATETETETETETTVSTLDPVAVSRSSAAAASRAAAVKSSASVSKAAAAAAAAAKAGPIYYSMTCDIEAGEPRKFNTYQDTWKVRPAPSYCDADPAVGGIKHGAQLTSVEQKALTVADGSKADPADLSMLFARCGVVDDDHAPGVFKMADANELAGALLICPNHPNAAARQSQIEVVKEMTGGDPNVSLADLITYAVSGTASSASVTYSQQGGSIAQESDVQLPWSKNLRISGDYRFFSISAQNQGDSGSVTCTISLAGNVIDTVTSTGAYVIASCTGPTG